MNSGCRRFTKTSATQYAWKAYVDAGVSCAGVRQTLCNLAPRCLMGQSGELK